MTTAALSRALLRRELTLRWLAMLFVLSAAAAYAALQPPVSSDVDIISRLLRRGDLALIGLVVMLAASDVTQRVADDRRARWLESYIAAGGSAPRYVLCAIAVVALTRCAWAVAASVTFAGAAWLSTGSVELLAAAPALVASAALLVLCITAFAALFALLLREPISALLLALVAGTAPSITASLHELRTGDAPPGALRAWILCCTPPVQLVDSARAVVTDSLSLLLVLLLAAVLSRRAVGMHA